MPVAVVTGVSRGIGAAVAESLLQAGFSVAGISRTRSQRVERFFDEHQEFVFHEVDLSDQAGTAQLATKLAALPHSYTLLVNCAGMAQRKDLQELTADDWHHIFQVNVFSAAELTRRLLPALLKGPHSSVINIGSIAGSVGGRYQVHYAAAKSALENFSRSLNNLYSARGLRAFLVEVGQVDTDMMLPEIAETGEGAIVSQIPIGRMGDPAEVGEVVRLIATELPHFLGGQTIRLNGGLNYG